MRPVAPAPVPPVRRSGLTTALSIIWALIPLVSLGFAAPFSFLYAAVRRRSWYIGAAAALYGVGGAVTLSIPMTPDPDVFTFWDNVGVTIVVLVTGVSTAHAFVIRRRVFGSARTRTDRGLDDAFEMARQQQELRQRSREMAAQNPSFARRVGMGRPDLPRAYDDGGLIDVNHAPPAVLARLPGMTPERVERIVLVRAERGTFVSADEVVVFANLPPDLARELADFAIFLP